MNRRPFLKSAAGAALAAGLARGQETAAPAKKLGWALVGLGSLSKNQIAPALLETAHSRLAAVVTGTPEKGVDWRAKYGLAENQVYSYRTFDTLLEDSEVDVVYIVLPNSMHHEFTLRAAKAGKHVFCEKPMADNAAQAREMIAACAGAKRRLGVAYRLQFEPHHQGAIRFCRGKTFGPVRHIDAGFGFKMGDPTQWRLKKALAGGGAMMDVGVYALQACRYLSGEEPSHVMAMETKTDPVKFAEVDETIQFSLKFSSGITANCVTTYGFNGINEFSVTADNGRFGLRSAYGYDGQTGWTSNPDIPLKFKPVDHFVAEMDAFSLAIKEDKPFGPSGEEGLRDMLVVDAVYRSIRSGKLEAIGKI